MLQVPDDVTFTLEQVAGQRAHQVVGRLDGRVHDKQAHQAAVQQVGALGMVQKQHQRQHLLQCVLVLRRAVRGAVDAGHRLFKRRRDGGVGEEALQHEPAQLGFFVPGGRPDDFPKHGFQAKVQPVGMVAEQQVHDGLPEPDVRRQVAVFADHVPVLVHAPVDGGQNVVQAAEEREGVAPDFGLPAGEHEVAVGLVHTLRVVVFLVCRRQNVGEPLGEPRGLLFHPLCDVHF